MQRADVRDEALAERVVHLRQHEHPLDAEAILPRLGEGAGGDRRHGAIEIRVRHHQDGRVRAQFHAELLDAGRSRDPQAGVDAAGEGHQADARVGDEGVAEFLAAAGDDVQPAGRKSRVHQVACEAQRGERRRRAGLQHHGVPARERRPDLVAGHRERVVERRDRPDHADREPEVIAHAVFGTDPAVEGQRLAREPPPLLRRQAKQRDAPDRLTARFADRLAPFEGNRARVALDVRFDARRRARQHVVAGMGRPRPIDRLRGGRHRGGDVAGAPARHGVDQPAVEGVRHVDGLVAANPLAVDQHPRPAAVAGPWPAAVITGHSPLRSLDT